MCSTLPASIRRRGLVIIARMSAQTWLREPLLHFALFGAGLFGLYGLVGEPEREPERIEVSPETLARIEGQQGRRLGREPSQEELDAAVRAWADAEMLYREARRLGLDRGDPIVRRRLTQKMQFLFEESVDLPEPSDAQLETWIAEHADRFEQAPRVGLTHVFVASSSRVVPEAKLVELEQQLREGAEPSSLGEAFPLGQEVAAKTEIELERSFGPGFGEAVFELPEQGWHRVRSLYGWHLVHVDARTPGRLSNLDEVRAQAREGLQREARERAQLEQLEQLREHYLVEYVGAEDGG